MSGTAFEKVLMDTTFKHCQSIYTQLSNLLYDVDIEVGDINQINFNILTLCNNMHKLLCVAETAIKCGQYYIPRTLKSEAASISKISEGASCQVISDVISFKDGIYNCIICLVTLKNIDHVVRHIRSRKHNKICKNQSTCFSNIMRDNGNIGTFYSLLPAHLKINTAFIQPTEYKCTLCECILPYSFNGIYQHIVGKKHMDNLSGS